VSIPGQIADDNAHGFALIEVRLREYWRKVQKFNDREDRQSENIELLNS
jgi:hypothetical protein